MDITVDVLNIIKSNKDKHNAKKQAREPPGINDINIAETKIMMSEYLTYSSAMKMFITCKKGSLRFIEIVLTSNRIIERKLRSKSRHTKKNSKD